MDQDFTKYLFAREGKSPQNVRLEEHKEGRSLTESIFELERKICKCCAEIDSGNIRGKLLSFHQKKVEHLLSQVDEITKRIIQKHEKCKKLTKNSQVKRTFYSRKTASDDGGNQVHNLESPCLRSIRESCNTACTYFDKEFSVAAGIKPKDSDVISKDDLWLKAENIAHGFSPEEIQEAILLNIQECTSDLKELTAKVDVKRDAQNLKFRFETGKLHDVSMKPVLMQTVRQLIEDGQVSHFERFIRSEKAKHEQDMQENKLKSLNDHILNIIDERYSSNKELYKLLLLEQEKASCNAALNYMENEILKLKEDRTDRLHALSKLQKKYNRIKNFDKTVQCKQTMIQNLIKSNGSSKAHHHHQHEDIIKLVEQKILTMGKELQSTCEKFKDACALEEKQFLKTPLQNLQCMRTKSGKRVPVSDLSIYRFDSYFNQPGEKQLDCIMNGLKIPTYVPPESLMIKFAEVQARAYDHASIMEDNNKQLELLLSIHASAINDHEELITRKTEDVQNCLPALKENETKCSAIMTECIKFRSAAQIWWEQPAQYTVPWISEEGMNVKQYVEQFRHYAETLKKIQLVG